MLIDFYIDIFLDVELINWNSIILKGKFVLRYEFFGIRATLWNIKFITRGTTVLRNKVENHRS